VNLLAMDIHHNIMVCPLSAEVESRLLGYPPALIIQVLANKLEGMREVQCDQNGHTVSTCFLLNVAFDCHLS
jgi:hypothetical protein